MSGKNFQVETVSASLPHCLSLSVRQLVARAGGGWSVLDLVLLSSCLSVAVRHHAYL